MNSEQYKKYKEEPKYKKYNVDSYTKTIHISDVEIDKKSTSQFRNGGHIVKNVATYAQLLRDPNHKLPPASVRLWLNGKATPKDGSTRLLGEKENFLNGVHPNDGYIDVNTFVDEVLSKEPNFDWDTWQAQANNHINPSPNTKDDAQAYIDRQIKEKVFERLLSVDYNKDRDNFIEKCVEHLKDVFSNSGWNATTYKGFLEKSLSGANQTGFKNYTKNTAIEVFADLNDIGYDPVDPSKAKAGDIHNNVCVYLAGKKEKMSPVVLGNTAMKKIDNNCDVVVVYWEERTATLSEASLFAHRSAVEKMYDKIQGKYNLFSGLYFLPQIETGEQRESMSKLITSRSK